MESVECYIHLSPSPRPNPSLRFSRARVSTSGHSTYATLVSCDASFPLCFYVLGLILRN